MSDNTFHVEEKYTGGISLEISETKYNALLESKNIISACIEVEHLFSLMPISYFEFERTIFDNTLHYLIGTHPIEDTEYLFRDIGDSLNLKILTLLNAGQAYKQQLPQRLKAIEKAYPEIKQKVKDQFNQAYDSSFEYRIMEALRNHSQHSSLPLYGTSLNISNRYQNN